MQTSALRPTTPKTRRHRDRVAPPATPMPTGIVTQSTEGR